MKENVRSGNTKRINPITNQRKEPINMKTKHRLIKAFSSLALVAACAIWVSSAQAQNYTLTDLGVLPGATESTAGAINDSGQVAGTSGETAFRYTKEGKVPMENVAERSMKGIHRGFGMNGSGLVVGDSTFGMAYCRAALFSNGIATNLGTLRGGVYSRANGINSLGWVVGFTSEKPDQADGKAFLIRALDRSSRMIDLGTLGGTHAQAWGVNDSGYVTGNAEVTKSEATHAFVWHSKTGMLDLGTLAGNFSYGMFISANNHIVGYSTINEENDRVHAFLYDGSTMLDLGSLGGASMESDRSFALGVNAADEVVGYSYVPVDGSVVGLPPEIQRVAFVYRNGLMMDLNELIGSAVKRYQLHSATAINDKGQVVGIAFDREMEAFRAVLLTPTTGRLSRY
jgi:probable HAF family extracellular repeat protein